MNRAILLVLAAVVLAGCGTPEPVMTPVPKAVRTPEVPEGGRLLDTEFGPVGLSVPVDASIVEQIDQVNNITLVFDAPDGKELADYYRAALPRMGFTITADANDSLLFEDEDWTGGFTAAEGHSALTLRTDWG